MSKARKNLSKSQSAEPQQTADRAAALDNLLGDRLSAIAAHLQDLANLLYENDDHFGQDPMIQGVQSLLSAHAEKLEDMARPFQAREGGAE